MTFKLLIGFATLVQANVLYAGACGNVDTSPVTNNPYSYTNPNTSCGGNFSMPGLPDMSFSASDNCNGNIRSIYEDAVGDAVNDWRDQVDDLPNTLPPVEVHPPSNDQTNRFCQQNPEYCDVTNRYTEPGDTGVPTTPPPRFDPSDLNPKNPGVATPKPTQNKEPVTAQPTQRFCHPSDPNDPRNSSTCKYRKIITPEQNDKPAVEKEEEVDLQNYWKKRFEGR